MQGRDDVVALAATAASADQALFLVRAVSILADRNEQAPIDVLLARGTLVARQKSGQIVAPLPADYVAWTEDIARFAQREDLAAAERGVWISGRTTSRARQHFEELGWAVHEGVKPSGPGNQPSSSERSRARSALSMRTRSTRECVNSPSCQCIDCGERLPSGR